VSSSGKKSPFDETRYIPIPYSNIASCSCGWTTSSLSVPERLSVGIHKFKCIHNLWFFFSWRTCFFHQIFSYWIDFVFSLFFFISMILFLFYSNGGPGPSPLFSYISKNLEAFTISYEYWTFVKINRVSTVIF